MIAIRPLARLAAARTRDTADAHCELCSVPLGQAHRHVVEVGRRDVLCACAACAILFAAGERSARYRTVPDRVRVDRELALVPQRIGIPVGVAFCMRSSSDQLIARYPGPAGIVDAELAAEDWHTLAAATPLVAQLEPDVEALLLHGDRAGSHAVCYLIPITAAYELVARLRGTWQGFTGGDQAHREVAAFFAELDRKATPA